MGWSIVRMYPSLVRNGPRSVSASTDQSRKYTESFSSRLNLDIYAFSSLLPAVANKNATVDYPQVSFIA